MFPVAQSCPRRSSYTLLQIRTLSASCFIPHFQTPHPSASAFILSYCIRKWLGMDDHNFGQRAILAQLPRSAVIRNIQRASDASR